MPRRRLSSGERFHRSRLLKDEAFYSNQWVRNMERGLTFLERLKVAPALGGEVWKVKMLAHYGEKVKDLLKIRPIGQEQNALRFRERLRKLLRDD